MNRLRAVCARQAESHFVSTRPDTRSRSTIHDASGRAIAPRDRRWRARLPAPQSPDDGPGPTALLRSTSLRGECIHAPLLLHLDRAYGRRYAATYDPVAPGERLARRDL